MYYIKEMVENISKQEKEKYCEILEVSLDVNLEELEKSWKRLSLQWHPDRWVSASDDEKKYAKDMIQMINDAHDKLKEEIDGKEEDLLERYKKEFRINMKLYEDLNVTREFLEKKVGTQELNSLMGRQQYYRQNNFPWEINSLIEESYIGDNIELKVHRTPFINCLDLYVKSKSRLRQIEKEINFPELINKVQKLIESENDLVKFNKVMLDMPLHLQQFGNDALQKSCSLIQEKVNELKNQIESLKGIERLEAKIVQKN